MLGSSEADAQTTTTPVSPSHTPAAQGELWYFFQDTSDVSQQQKLTLRLYQPFFFDIGWQLTMREDIRVLYTNQIGTDNPDGAWRAHIGDMFAQAALKTPHIAPGLSADLGQRVFFPTGDLGPFGTGRYQIGPHFGLIWDLPDLGRPITFAPLVRYMQSFGEQPPHSVATAEFQFHPIIAVKPWTGWMVSLWREHPMILNTLTNRWFIPLDAMVTWEFMPHMSVGIGGAVSLVADYPQYDNIAYGRVALSF